MREHVEFYHRSVTIGAPLLRSLCCLLSAAKLLSYMRRWMKAPARHNMLTGETPQPGRRVHKVCAVQDITSTLVQAIAMLPSRLSLHSKHPQQIICCIHSAMSTIPCLLCCAKSPVTSITQPRDDIPVCVDFRVYYCCVHLQTCRCKATARHMCVILVLVALYLSSTALLRESACAWSTLANAAECECVLDESMKKLTAWAAMRPHLDTRLP